MDKDRYYDDELMDMDFDNKFHKKKVEPYDVDNNNGCRKSIDEELDELDEFKIIVYDFNKKRKDKNENKH